jgi:peroxiredoxin
MKSVVLTTVIALVLVRGAFAQDEAQTTRVKTGDPAPDFTCQTLSGEEFALAKNKGKVVLVNFFATWCGPCMMEMPHLEKDVFQKYSASKDFKLIAIGREHTASELQKFQSEKKFSLPIAADPKREIYAKYAEKYIPRNFIIGKDGKIKFSSMGYSEADFRQMLQVLQQELK